MRTSYLPSTSVVVARLAHPYLGFFVMGRIASYDFQYIVYISA